MPDSNHIPLTSSELGNLWLTYQEKTMSMRFVEHFLEHAEDEDTRQILMKRYDNAGQSVETIKDIFQKEGAALPVGFTENDVNKGVPRLFGPMYDVMFVHMMCKIETNLFALFSTMSYRKDIRDLYIQLTATAQNTFAQCAHYLLEKGVLARPPYMTMPKEIRFIKNKDYLSGFNFLKETRSLNAIEISLIHHAIETNLTGMQLMIAFAQVAHDPEVKEYFAKGMKLSKDIETTLGEFFRQDYIEPPATHAGKATASTVPPFSDKMMMYLTNLLSIFGLGSNSLGGAFSLRSDLTLTMARLTPKIYNFAKRGGEIMIKHGWMEEPPPVEDRKTLIKV